MDFQFKVEVVVTQFALSTQMQPVVRADAAASCLTNTSQMDCKEQ